MHTETSLPVDFESVSQRHSEGLIELVLRSWETYNGVRHSHLASLKDRWEYFIAKTDEVLIDEKAKHVKNRNNSD